MFKWNTKSYHMEDQLFEDLCAGIREAGAHRRGEIDIPAERVHLSPDPRSIRTKLHMTQTEFADLLGVPAGTLRNWEQGRRGIDPAAVTLLRIAERSPDLLRALHEENHKLE